MYFVYLEVKPSPDVVQLQGVSGAMAHVWVLSESEQSAHELAFEYVRNYGWNIVSVEQSVLMQPEHLVWFEKEKPGLYRKVLDSGAASEFYAWSGKKPEIDLDIRFLNKVDG